MLKYWDGTGRKGTICNGYKAQGGRLRRKYYHRLLIEQILGRELKNNEVVHHKDGNKLNNSIENLELFSKSEHARMHAKARGLGKERIGISPVNKIDTKTIEKIIKLRKEKKTLEEIKQILNVSEPTMIKYLKENNITIKLSRWRNVN